MAGNPPGRNPVGRACIVAHQYDSALHISGSGTPPGGASFISRSRLDISLLLGVRVLGINLSSCASM